MRRHLAELPQGRKAARAGELCRVRGGPLHARARRLDRRDGSSIRSCRSSTWRSCVRSPWPARSWPRRGAGTFRSCSASCWPASCSGRPASACSTPSDPTFTFLGNAGFVLVMFVAGTHVPVRDPRLRTALRTGAVRAAVVGRRRCRPRVRRGDAGRHLPRPAVRRADGVVLGSAGAAHRRLSGADRSPTSSTFFPRSRSPTSLCIVLLPLVIDTGHVARAALGAAAVRHGGCRPLLICSRWSSAAASVPVFTTSRRTASSRSSSG